MLGFVKKILKVDDGSVAGREEGFTLMESVIGITLLSIVGAMIMSIMINVFNLQRDFMERSVYVEFSQATNLVSSNRLINIYADEAQMKSMWNFTSNVDTVYYYSGGAQDWKLYAVNEAFDKCYYAGVENSSGSEVDCDIIVSELN